MKNIYVLSVTTENTLRVLQRITTIFTRNRVNIEQLNVFETARTGTSHFNIVIHSEEKSVDKLVRQLRRIVELLDINISNTIPIHQEVAETEKVMG